MATALTLNAAAVSGTLATSDPNRPDSKSAAYERMLARSEKCRALIEGLEAIQDGGEDFLPRYPLEDDASYNARGSWPRSGTATRGR
jgi:hypothetical protein